MKIEGFFDKFELFADTTNAVEKLRELVLNLAIDGRLVDNCAENPLSVHQILLEKERALLELHLRSHPETSLPNEDDLPFALPESWNVLNLGDLLFSCPTSYGEDPSPSLVAAGVVKVGNINNQGGFKGEFSPRWFTPAEIESLLARQGDLMVVKSSGSAQNVHSGKTALCRAEHDGKIVGSNFVLRLRTFGSAAIPEYLWRLLTSRYSRAWVANTVQTMTYPNLKWSDFARLPVPLPPLDEQKRIVAKVDEFMVLCDRLDSQLRERDRRRVALARASVAKFAEAPTTANLNLLFHDSYSIEPSDLRDAILTLAIHGRLVSQDPSDEPAQSLNDGLTSALQRIADGVGSRFVKRNGAIEGRNDLPPGWGFAQLRSIGLTQTGTTPSKLDASFGGSHIPFVKPGDIRGHRVDYGKEGLSTQGLMAGRLIPKNSVIMVSIGGSIGKTAIVDRDISCNQQINSVTPAPSIEPNFVLVAITSSDFQTEVMKRTAQGTLPIISKSKWETIGIPIPPFNEQRRIVAKVRQLMALVDKLDAEVAALRGTATGLVNAVVGELSNNALAVEGGPTAFKLRDGARRSRNLGAESDLKAG